MSALGTIKIRVVVTRNELERIFQALNLEKGKVAVCQPDVHAFDDRMDIVCRSFRFCLPWEMAAEGKAQVVVGVSQSKRAVLDGWKCLEYYQRATGRRKQDGKILISLLLFKEEAKLLATGIVHSGDTYLPVHGLQLVGSGMDRIETVDFAEDGGITRLFSPERWSRTVGGLGNSVWEKFVTLKFCVVGLGRNGSLFASSLGRYGVQKLTLIDPDILEEHNLDIMEGVLEEDVGKYKVYALKSYLERVNSEARIDAKPEPVYSCLDDIRGSDVVVSCMDNNAARLFLSMACGRFLKPLLDVGTGIFYRGDSLLPDIGADLRLIVPGERCLYCFGGFAEALEKLKIEMEKGVNGESKEQSAWNTGRLGSLRSINQIGIGTALTLLENFLRGVVRESTWIRVRVDDKGFPIISDFSSQALKSCPFCSRLI